MPLSPKMLFSTKSKLSMKLPPAVTEQGRHQEALSSFPFHFLNSHLVVDGRFSTEASILPSLHGASSLLQVLFKLYSDFFLITGFIWGELPMTGDEKPPHCRHLACASQFISRSASLSFSPLPHLTSRQLWFTASTRAWHRATKWASVAIRADNGSLISPCVNFPFPSFVSRSSVYSTSPEKLWKI